MLFNLSMSSKSNMFFICNSCGIQQNIDQSIHIKKKYCVSCYNKEQLYWQMIERFDFYERQLKEANEYTKIRRKKINFIKKISLMILPQTIFHLEVNQIKDYLIDKRKDAIKKSLVKISKEEEKGKKRYNFGDIKDFNVKEEWLERLKSIWTWKSIRKDSQMEEFKDLLSELITLDSLSGEELKNLFMKMKKEIKLSYVHYDKITHKISIRPYELFFKYSTAYVLNNIKTYRERILQETTQTKKFKYFLRYIGRKCQFQTVDNKLVGAIEDYIKEHNAHKMDLLYKRIHKEIRQMEDANLIPNIAKYIMDNQDFIFHRWFAQLLPFDKHRFTASQAKTGSRTDFVVRLEYIFNNKELVSLGKELYNTTELNLREKLKKQVKNYRSKKDWDKEKIEKFINKKTVEFENTLKPDNFKLEAKGREASALMVARYLIINSEKSFNMILNKIMRYHYKRLKINSPVSYVTNVLESGADILKSRNQLTAYYIIQSREW